MNSPNDKQTSSSLAGYQSTVVDHAHRAFFGDDPEEVRSCLQAVFDDDTPFTRHKLESALMRTGIERKPDRVRVMSFLLHSPKFKEALGK